MTPCWSFHFLCHLGVVFAIFRGSLGQSCTFQSDLCGWISIGSGPRWRSSRDPNISSSSTEEPASYAYVTISQNTDNGTTILQGPEVTAATTDTIEISFQYQLLDHSQGEITDALSVRWSRNGGDFDDVWHTSGPTDSWVTTSLVLAQGGVFRFTVQFVAEITVPSQDATIRIRNAEVKIKHDSCASAPCLHGGLCFGNGLTFTCICTGGYRGERCQILPGVPLSKLFRGRTSARGVTTAGPESVGMNITSMATLKGSPGHVETTTNIPASHASPSLTSEKITEFQTIGTAESSTSAVRMKITTNPTSATRSSLSPCFRRSTVPAVTVATTSPSIVTEEVTNIGTPIEETSTTSFLRTTSQSEPEHSTTQTASTRPQWTETTLTPFSSSLPELTSSDFLKLTSISPSVTDPTTKFDLSPLATDVVRNISSTNDPRATQSFTSTKTEVPSSVTEHHHSTIPDESTTSLESTESIRSTSKTVLISFGTERTTLEMSQRSETSYVVTQSLTTKEDVGTNTETTNLSTNDPATTETLSTTKISTQETPTYYETSEYSLSTDSQTSKNNDLVTQISTTKDELRRNTDYTSTSVNDIFTSEAVTTSKLSTEERTTDFKTSEYIKSTGAPDLSTIFRPTIATTEIHEFETSQAPTTLQTLSNTESSEYKTLSSASTEATEATRTYSITQGSITDIQTTVFGAQSTSSSSSSSPSSLSSSSPSSSSSSLSLSSSPSSSSSRTSKITSDVFYSTEAPTVSANKSRTTENISTSSTEVIGSSQTSLNSSSAPISENDAGVNVPLTVGLSVAGAVGLVAAGAAIFIVRRARRVSYGLTE